MKYVCRIWDAAWYALITISLAHSPVFNRIVRDRRVRGAINWLLLPSIGEIISMLGKRSRLISAVSEIRREQERTSLRSLCTLAKKAWARLKCNSAFLRALCVSVVRYILFFDERQRKVWLLVDVEMLLRNDIEVTTMLGPVYGKICFIQSKYCSYFHRFSNKNYGCIC